MPSSSRDRSTRSRPARGYSFMTSMPSPRIAVRWGEPSVSTARTNVSRCGSDGTVAAHEGLHALHERLLRPGRDQQHAHVGGRPLGEPPRHLEQRHDAGRVVVCARHHLRRADLRDHGRGAGRDDAAARSAAARLPGERAERGQRRAAEDGEHQRRAGVAALDQRREAAATRRPGSPGGRSARTWRRRGGRRAPRSARASAGPISATTLNVSRLGSSRRAWCSPAGDVVPHARGRGSRERGRRRRRLRPPASAPSAPPTLSSVSGTQ